MGCVRESLAAVRLPIAKADPVAGGAPILEILAPVASIVVVVVTGGSVLTLAPVVVVGTVAAAESVVVVSGVVVGTGVGITTGLAGGFVGGLVVGLVVGSVVGIVGVGNVVESLFVVSCFVVSVVGTGVGVGGFVGVCAVITMGRMARPATPRILSLIGSP